MPNQEIIEKIKPQIDEFLTKFLNRKSAYNRLLVETALVKQAAIWENAFTGLVLLSENNEIEPNTLCYDDLFISTHVENIENVQKIIDNLIDKDTLKLEGCPDAIFEIGFFERRDWFPSNEGPIDLGWPRELYGISSSPKTRAQIPNMPLLIPDKPYYPDGRYAIQSIFGKYFRNAAYDGQILIVLPDYTAKIEEINISSKETSIKISAGKIDRQSLIGKLFCKGDQNSLSKDILFLDNDQQVIQVGFMPIFMHFYLLNRETGEVIDKRLIPIQSLGQTVPKGITIEIAEEDIHQYLKQGENERTEFKRELGKDLEIDEFIESIVAFANSFGGVILVGVDDRANVKGIDDNHIQDKISDYLSSRCEPPIKPQMTFGKVDNKTVLIVHVEQGNNKPYLLRGKGIYVRAGATDRLASRIELDDFYRDKNEQSNQDYLRRSF